MYEGGVKSEANTLELDSTVLFSRVVPVCVDCAAVLEQPQSSVDNFLSFKVPEVNSISLGVSIVAEPVEKLNTPAVTGVGVGEGESVVTGKSELTVEGSYLLKL
jgi:hypothetical protein